MGLVPILKSAISLASLLVLLNLNGLAVAEPLVSTEVRNAPAEGQTAQQAPPTPFPPVHTTPPVHTLKVRPRLPDEARDASGRPFSAAPSPAGPPSDADVKVVRTVPLKVSPAKDMQTPDKR
jgi:hypothetical protein